MSETTVAGSATASRPAPASGGETIVRLEGVSKWFTRRRSLAATVRHPFSPERFDALRDISFEIAQGEFFGLLGPNGAGKSTLFRVLATLVLPDAGTVEVAGLDAVDDADEVRRVVAIVTPDERSLYWRLSAVENLRLFGSLHGLRGERLRSRVADVLDVVGLSDTGPKYAGQFSTGMRQRLLIARALLPDPRVLLLDEPTRSLDPISARDLRRFLREELVGRRGCTVLLATHSADEAFELCDRVGVLHRGTLLAAGSVDTLAAGLTETRYRLLTDQPRHAMWPQLTGNGATAPVESATEGWWWMEIALDGGPSAVAGVVSNLAAVGVNVGEVERVRLSLADLLERMVADEASVPRKGSGEEIDG